MTKNKLKYKLKIFKIPILIIFALMLLFLFIASVIELKKEEKINYSFVCALETKNNGEAEVDVENWIYGNDNEPVITSTTNNYNDVVIEYKEQGEDDENYSSVKPIFVGDYVIRVTLPENDSFNEVIVIKDFKISQRDIEIKPKPQTVEGDEEVESSPLKLMSDNNIATGDKITYVDIYRVGHDLKCKNVVISRGDTVVNENYHITYIDSICHYYDVGCDSTCNGENCSMTRATNHSLYWVDAKEPTCDEVGWYDYQKCHNCDYTTYLEREAVGHQYGDWIIDRKATCIAIGNKHRICSTCENEEHKVINELGHDITSYEKKEPTCTETGYDSYEKCGRCEYTTYSEIEALGHNVDTWTVIQKETCTQDGSKTGYCDRCKQDATVVVEKLGHDLTYFEAKPVSCSENGYDAYEVCSRCEHNTYNEIKALGHDLNSFARQEPTCINAGHEAYECCSRCDYTTYIEIEALGHDLIHHEALEATENKYGHEAYDECTRCGYTTFKRTNRKYGDNTFVKIILYVVIGVMVVGFIAVIIITKGNKRYRIKRPKFKR